MSCCTWVGAAELIRYIHRIMLEKTGEKKFNFHLLDMKCKKCWLNRFLVDLLDGNICALKLLEDLTRIVIIKYYMMIDSLTPNTSNISSCFPPIHSCWKSIKSMTHIIRFNIFRLLCTYINIGRHQSKILLT